MSQTGGTPAFSSDVANSPGITTIQNDWIGELLAGSVRNNIIIASVAAGMYILFLILSIVNIALDKRPLHLLLMLFCAIRVVAFSVRAYMQKYLSQNLAIVYEVFFAVGFVFLLKLLVSLLAAWTMPVGILPKQRRFSIGLLRNNGSGLERLVTVSLMVGAICSIIGATDAYDGAATVKEYNKGLSLMKAGYTIYLAAVGIFLFMVISGPLLNRLSFGRPTSMRSATMVVLALLVCGLLLCCKCVFQVIAIYTNPRLLFKNKLFYPLEVIPELCVLAIICAPGFINHVLKGSHAHPELDGHGKQPAGTISNPQTPGNAATPAPSEHHAVEEV